MTERTREELADILNRVAKRFLNSSPQEGWIGYAKHLDAAARRLRERDGERIEGWVDDPDPNETGMWLNFYPDKPRESYSLDANGKQMAEWIPATLILHPREPTDG